MCLNPVGDTLFAAPKSQDPRTALEQLDAQTVPTVTFATVRRVFAHDVCLNLQNRGFEVRATYAILAVKASIADDAAKYQDEYRRNLERLGLALHPATPFNRPARPSLASRRRPAGPTDGLALALCHPRRPLAPRPR